MLFMFEDVYLTQEIFDNSFVFQNRLTEFKTETMYTVYTRNIHIIAVCVLPVFKLVHIINNILSILLPTLLANEPDIESFVNFTVLCVLPLDCLRILLFLT